MTEEVSETRIRFVPMDYDGAARRLVRRYLDRKAEVKEQRALMERLIAEELKLCEARALENAAEIAENIRLSSAAAWGTNIAAEIRRALAEVYARKAGQ